MSLRSLPAIEVTALHSGAQWQPPEGVLARWHPEIRAASDGENAVAIYEQIGENWDGTGVTAKWMAQELHRVGALNPVTVSINSPGGDFFEGVAIYNLLRMHKAQVNVNVVGLAGSAASLIAMAGDTIRVSPVGFFMIHNAQAVAVGSRLDMLEIVQVLTQIDSAMVGLYADRTGQNPEDISKMMDADTWMDGAGAVEAGFADELMPTNSAKAGATARAEQVKWRVDALLAKQGVPRAQRREMFRVMSGMRDAVGEGGMRDAALTASLQDLLSSFRS